MCRSESAASSEASEVTDGWGEESLQHARHDAEVERHFLHGEPLHGARNAVVVTVGIAPVTDIRDTPLTAPGDVEYD